MYDNRKTKVETTAPWCSFETGLWIDIFPLDGVDTDETSFIDNLKRLKPIATKIAMMRTSNQGFWETKTLRRKFTWIIKKLYTFGCSLLDMKNNYIQMISSRKFETSEFVGQLACFDSYTHKECHPKEDYEKYVDVEFEGVAFKAMGGYDRVLRRYYSDYMQLPPEKDRIPRQDAYMKYYWK